MGNKLGHSRIEEDFVFDEESLMILEELENKYKIKIKKPHEKKIMLELWMRSELDEKNPNTQKEYDTTVKKLQSNKSIKKKSTLFDSKLDHDPVITSLGLEEMYNFRCSNDDERKKVVNLHFKLEMDSDDETSRNEFHSFVKNKKLTF